MERRVVDSEHDSNAQGESGGHSARVVFVHEVGHEFDR